MAKCFNRGVEAENRIERHLIELMGEGLIDDYIKSRKNDNLDIKGIDFLVFYNYEVLPLQVKSSTNAIKLHKNKYPFIPVINAYENDVKQKLIEIILHGR